MTTKEIQARAAGKALSNVTAKANAKGLTAKKKQPTKVEIIRGQAEKHKALATKNATAKGFDLLASTFVTEFGKSESACRDLAAFLNMRWAEDMAGAKLHWTAVYRSNNAKVEGTNFHGWYKQIVDVQKQVAELVQKNPKISHASRNAPWSRVMRLSLEMSDFAGREAAPAQLTSVKAKKKLIEVYKMLMKEEVQTELDEVAAGIVGDLLRSKFKVDLSTLNV
jgi:hypothetical protein